MTITIFFDSVTGAVMASRVVLGFALAVVVILIEALAMNAASYSVLIILFGLAYELELASRI